MAVAGLGVLAGELVVDAGRGPVTIHIPSGYDPNRPTPLLLMLHGYTSTGAFTENVLFQMLPLVDEYNFLYAFPDGTIDSVANGFWNATDACCNFFGSGVNDVDYLVGLIDAVRAEFNVDPWGVYLLGHSNGGFMSHRMACDEADLVAAIASLAGATFANPADCTPDAPIHVLQIHGTSDATIAYAGGALNGIVYPGAVQTVELWAVQNGCSPQATPSSQSLDLEIVIPGAETTVTRHTDGCNAGGSAELWTIDGGAHNPNLMEDFRRGVFEFLRAHRKLGLVFNDKTTINWPQVHWARRYQIYRGALSDLVDVNGDGLADGGYGECMNGGDPDISDTELIDTELPTPGEGFFYVMGFSEGPGANSVLGLTSTGLGREASSACQ